MTYVDYGPNPHKTEDRFKTMIGRVRAVSRWANRPFCDMCGPFRGRYLRTMPNGEQRCRGCDRENGLE